MKKKYVFSATIFITQYWMLTKGRQHSVRTAILKMWRW